MLGINLNPETKESEVELTVDNHVPCACSHPPAEHHLCLDTRVVGCIGERVTTFTDEDSDVWTGTGHCGCNAYTPVTQEATQ